MRIDPRAVRLFLAICRAGSISGAARAENLSQPSVSVAVAQLERRLGAKLFDRHRSGIKLTPAGIALQRHAQAMETLLATAQREVHLIDVGVVGPLVIAGTPGALGSIVPRTVSSLREDHPRFELSILERSDKAVMELLRDQRADLGIVTAGMDQRPLEYEETPLLTDPFSLVVGRENDHLPEQMSLHELGDMRWILPEVAGGFRRQIDALFVTAEVPAPNNVIRCDSLLTTKEIVRRTDYVTILPREVTAAEVASGLLRAIRIREVKIQRKVGIVRLKEREPTVLAAAFLDHARRAAIV
jgi:molybdate transport repressor ModE-like protein